jgi:septation ring formation regulator EzrA
VGGREISGLDEIVHQRVNEILSNLPPLSKAVRIIDPDTAAMIDKVEKLKAQGQKLKDEVDEVSQPIIMAEVDQKMSVGEFRSLVKEREQKRKALLMKMQEIGKEGSQLEEIVYKKLYKGLPGLSDAVVDIAKTHLDRSTALDTMSRRVEEQVKFGDSETALQLLQHFEKDEVAVSEKVHAQFQEALEKLKLSVKKGRTAKVAKELR